MGRGEYQKMSIGRNGGGHGGGGHGGGGHHGGGHGGHHGGWGWGGWGGGWPYYGYGYGYGWPYYGYGNPYAGVAILADSLPHWQSRHAFFSRNRRRIHALLGQDLE